MKTVLTRAGRGLRDAWLIVGLTLVLVTLVECGYRAQSSLRQGVSAKATQSPAGPPSPFDATDWAAGYMAEHRMLDVKWAPYVYRRHPAFTGRYINVDTLGHRITPQVSRGTGTPIQVFVFGGSTAFGWFQRDQYTIPAEIARRFAERSRAARPVHVTNLAVAGHTFTQGMLELILQLRSGARPDVVVFYDGINDVMSTVQNRRPGFPQNEWNRENDFMRGRREQDESAPGLRNDVRAIRRVVGSIVRRSRLAQSIVARRSTGDTRPFNADSLAADLARMYAGNAQAIEALASRYGFVPIYVWQPALLSTHKRLTPFEQSLLQDKPAHVAALHVAAPAPLRAAMQSVAPGRFIDATTVLDRDTLDIYVDLFGHTHERANPRVVDALMPALNAAVARISQAVATTAEPRSTHSQTYHH